ncbi:MAG: YafY family protein [Caldilineaceae bacterium]
MYFPSTRLLNILDLLRSYGQLTARGLAKHLDVDARTVRRYMVMLEDLGMPVETVRGRYGGYRLRTGYHLPPVVFADDEALTLLLGLLVAERLGLANKATGVDLLLAKLARVAPAALRDQIHLLDQALAMRLPQAQVAITGATLLSLLMAAYQRQQVQLCYRATDGEVTERRVDPYGVVYTIGFWYLAGYCHLRQDLRTFRLDRIVQVEAMATTFAPPPPDFDLLYYVEASIARKPWVWSTQVQLGVPLAEAERLIPPAMARLEANAQGALLRCEVEDLRQFAHFLIGLPCPLTVLGPPELRQELLALSDRAYALAHK